MRKTLLVVIVAILAMFAAGCIVGVDVEERDEYFDRRISEVEERIRAERNLLLQEKFDAAMRRDMDNTELIIEGAMRWGMDNTELIVELAEQQCTLYVRTNVLANASLSGTETWKGKGMCTEDETGVFINSIWIKKGQ